jgi:hypothetical protein
MCLVIYSRSQAAFTLTGDRETGMTNAELQAAITQAQPEGVTVAVVLDDEQREQAAAVYEAVIDDPSELGVAFAEV